VLNRFLFASVGIRPTTASSPDVPWQLRTEIEHFFYIYEQLEHKQVEVRGWHPRERALEVIQESRESYRRAAGSHD
jgi:inorganic pyrophosphatase